MRVFPYRSRDRSTGREGGSPAERGGDRAVLVALGVLWVASLVDVAGAVIRHQLIGAAETLALMALFAIPWLVWGPPARGRS
jgi:hypothetical protein